MRVLLCDDEPLILATLSEDIRDAGHEVELVSDGDAALAGVRGGDFDCVVTDLAMPGADGVKVLAAARDQHMDAVMMTGHGSISTAVEAMRAGAFDFMEKPFPGDRLIRVLDLISEKRRAVAPGNIQDPSGRRGLAGVVGGASEKYRLMLDLARRAAASDATLLLVGESGTGKEVLASAIHKESARGGRAFVPVSCGAIAPGLLDDELFGHERGAFTDARNVRIGRFEEAEGGTLFLDDIDDMRLDTQVKLLRVLQEREIRRIGGSKSLRVDIRIIAASKADLDRRADDGQFRSDLLYRLQVIRLDIPPLRERREDIPALLTHFIAKHAAAPIPALSMETLAAVAAYDWPGNVRQLENAVCRSLAMGNGSAGISATDLVPSDDRAEGELGDLTLSGAVRKAERDHIEKVLAACGGNRSQAARILGISRKSLWEKMRLLKIDGDGGR
ncbi:MAG: sigma-54 dependent transcriptional regulator [Planctomycetota bacterium]|jgi:two-component system C4-dicarboxylate transport response regulator DctD|nr:sigma-54 dependent transcriptional regulator [Planctomycetota bacterium]